MLFRIKVFFMPRHFVPPIKFRTALSLRVRPRQGRERFPSKRLGEKVRFLGLIAQPGPV